MERLAVRPIILVAEDDPDDRLLIQDAVHESQLDYQLDFVEDGENALHFLRRQGKYNDRPAVMPDLILMDLNMPRKGGLETIAEIKEDQVLKQIPIIAWTTSEVRDDIERAYQLGVNSFITKPPTFDGLVKNIQRVNEYWFETVHLPGQSGS